jgi:Fic family protein
MANLHRRRGLLKGDTILIIIWFGVNQMDLVELLAQVDDLKAEIDALRPIDQEQEKRIMQKFRLDWTYHSNAIEGNSLSFGETKAFLLHCVTAQGKPFRDYLDIKGHHEALNYLLGIVRQQAPLTEAAVRELYEILLVEPYAVDAVTFDGRSTNRHIIPGQYKSMPNHVRTRTGEVHYYASPEETPAKMADLMAWYRRETDKNERHPLILAATFHYQFVTIHPFDDGNGRMARLLMNLILMQAGFPPVVIPLDAKNEYLHALEQADADNALTSFIDLIGQSLLISLDLFLRGAKGERIEDQKDLDKKLTLLQKRLDARKENLRPERTSSSKELFYSKVLTSLWLHLYDQLIKFAPFFHESEIEISHNNIRGLIEAKNVLPELLELLIQHDKNELHILYALKRFKTLESFSILVNLSIYLSKFNFDMQIQLLHHNSPKLLMSNKYDITVSDEEMQKHIQVITDEIYELIDRKTADL